MTRTDLDARTLARSLRRMAGDGSVEWVMEPIQADVLRDIADMLDENAELRETLKRRNRQFETLTDMWAARGAKNAKLRELLEAVLQCAGETKRDKGCDACPMYNGPWRNDGTWCLLRPTLRELGVEVDG